MSAFEILKQRLIFCRKEYIYHSQNERSYPMKAGLIRYYGNECKRVRDIIDRIL